MSEQRARFVDQTGRTVPALDLWPALIVPKEQLDAEIERLAGCAPASEWPAQRVDRPPARRGAGPRPRAGHPRVARRAQARRADAADSAQLDAGELLHPGQRLYGRRRHAHRLRAVRRLEHAVDAHLLARQRRRDAAGAAHLQQRRAAREDERSRRRRESARVRSAAARRPGETTRRAPARSARSGSPTRAPT